MPQSVGQDNPEMSEALRAFARLLARAAARELLAAGNRGGRDSEGSRAGILAQFMVWRTDRAVKVQWAKWLRC